MEDFTRVGLCLQTNTETGCNDHRKNEIHIQLYLSAVRTSTCDGHAMKSENQKRMHNKTVLKCTCRLSIHQIMWSFCASGCSTATCLMITKLIQGLLKLLLVENIWMICGRAVCVYCVFWKVLHQYLIFVQSEPIWHDLKLGETEEAVQPERRMTH